MNKRWLVLIYLVLVLMLLNGSFAEEEESVSSRFVEVIQNVIKMLAQVFTFENWFDNEETVIIGFLRFCVWAIAFAVFYFALRTANMGRSAAVISVFLSLIAAIFIPPSLLVLIGNIYGALAVFGIIYGAIFGIAYLIYTIPAGQGWGQFSRIALLGLLAVILRIVTNATSELKTTVVVGARTPGLPLSPGVVASFDTAANWALAFVILWLVFEIGRWLLGATAPGEHTVQGHGGGGLPGAMNRLFGVPEQHGPPAPPGHTPAAHPPGALPPGVYGPTLPPTTPVVTAAAHHAQTLDQLLREILQRMNRI